MPPTPKRSEERQGRHRRDFGVVEGGGQQVPEMPSPPQGARWLKHSRDWWHAVWCEDIAATWTTSDRPMVERLLTLVEERERARRGTSHSRLVEGSQGQPVLNPLAKYMLEVDKEIRQLEDRLGLSPRARLQLGVQFADASRSLADLAGAMGDDDEADADGEPDPRVVDAGG